MATNNPWDILPMEQRGDDDPDNIFRAVGSALTTWENLESVLASLFVGLCGAQQTEAAKRAFGIVASSASRRDMIEEAYRCSPFSDEPELADLGKVLDRVKNFGARRNEIAHGMVIPVIVEKDRSYYLAAADYSSRKKLNKREMVKEGYKRLVAGEAPGDFDLMLGKYAYTASQIGHYQNEFHALGATVWSFVLLTWKRNAEQAAK